MLDPLNLPSDVLATLIMESSLELQRRCQQDTIHRTQLMNSWLNTSGAALAKAATEYTNGKKVYTWVEVINEDAQHGTY